jgi:hypothetical protein
MYQGSLYFIIYFYFQILKELIVYFSYCFIIINNRLLVVKCYSSLVVSGFSRNEFNSYSLFNFYCYFTHFYLVLKLRGMSWLIDFYNFRICFVGFMVMDSGCWKTYVFPHPESNPHLQPHTIITKPVFV